MKREYPGYHSMQIEDPTSLSPLCAFITEKGVPIHELHQRESSLPSMHTFLNFNSKTNAYCDIQSLWMNRAIPNTLIQLEKLWSIARIGY